MRAENFIYFATICGFFIGVLFSLFYNLDIADFLYVTVLMTMLFYALALGSVAFYIKFVDIKKSVYFNVKNIDDIINIQIGELEKYENFIFESYKFIEKIEQEELEIIRKNKS